MVHLTKDHIELMRGNYSWLRLFQKYIQECVWFRLDVIESKGLDKNVSNNLIDEFWFPLKVQFKDRMLIIGSIRRESDETLSE
jgi:hypothetical protein